MYEEYDKPLFITMEHLPVRKENLLLIACPLDALQSLLIHKYGDTSEYLADISLKKTRFIFF